MREIFSDHHLLAGSLPDAALQVEGPAEGGEEGAGGVCPGPGPALVRVPAQSLALLVVACRPGLLHQAGVPPALLNLHTAPADWADRLSHLVAGGDLRPGTLSTGRQEDQEQNINIRRHLIDQ